MGNMSLRRVLPLILALFVGHALAPISVYAKEEQSKQKKKECEEAEKAAQKACNDSAPAAQQAQQQQNKESQNQGGSSQQNCDQRASILPALLGMLGALQGGCQQAQATCKEKCGKAKASPAEDCNDEEPTKKPKCQGTAQETSQKGSEDTGKCEQLDKNLAMIAQKIAEAAANLAAAKKCEQQTNKDCSDPKFALENQAQCKPTFNCNDPTTYAGDAEKAKQCQCQQNPRAQGCDGAQAAISTIPDPAKKPASETTLPTTSGSKTATGSSSAGSAGGSGPQSGGGFGGGSAGGGSRTGTEKGGGPARDGTAAKSDPTQVNAGDYGASGGSKVTGGGYPDPANANRGPAGKKILSRAEQNRVATRDGFTGPYGRSNWQKVRERYRDNQPTFTP